jgi:hypothetical protein
MYEYKFLPAPAQVQKGASTLNGADGLTRTLDSEINLVAGSGWEFLRTERMPVKGRWLFLPVTRQRDYLIFRRPLSEAERPHIPQTDAPAVRPRRVQTQGAPGRTRPGDTALA